MSDHAEALDAALAEMGEDVVLRKVAGTVNQAVVDVALRAMVVPEMPEPAASGSALLQEKFTLILSPKGIERAQWPGGVKPDFVGDPRVPLAGYKAVVRARERNIEAVLPRRIDNQLVRIELVCRG